MFKRQWESLRSSWAGRQEESVLETKGLAPGEPWERRGGVGAREAGRHELDEGAALWLGQPSTAWPSQLVSSSVFMILFSSQEEPPKHVSHGGKNTSTLFVSSARIKPGPDSFPFSNLSSLCPALDSSPERERLREGAPSSSCP